MICDRMKRIEVLRTDFDGNQFTEYDDVQACNFEDTGLHTYKCLTCNREGYYSVRAKLAAELGHGDNIYHADVEGALQREISNQRREERLRANQKRKA